MKLLGIETSSTVGSIALEVDGTVEAREIATPREQTDRLLELAHELLVEANLVIGDLDVEPHRLLLADGVEPLVEQRHRVSGRRRAPGQDQQQRQGEAHARSLAAGQAPNARIPLKFR